MSKFKEIELDTELEKVFRATDTLVAHLSRELGRTEPECVMAMMTWLEERQKTKWCSIIVPKTDTTLSAADTLEAIGVIFDTYRTGDEHTFLATIELYDGDRSPIKQVHDAMLSALGDDDHLMDLFEVTVTDWDEHLRSNGVH